ncbi:Putative transposase, YhgA-like [Fretibacterium fastidiosum]|uniref:Transposase, YhgA-like n=2 Tax=Fretibacterium fastidiosum TaxID=651822 RepID=A0AB94IXY4_9BACT|nr:Putative transposase, YhgA-like [Fretibacterium fastidiosum]
MAERDMTEKHLEGYNDVFADIVNVLLFNGERRVRPEDLQDARSRTLYKADGKLHEQERDVSKLWVSKGAVISLIGFENQTKVDRDMVLRVLGYEGADYRGQLSAGRGLYPVVTLVLYFGEAPWTGPRTLFERVSVAEGLRPFVNDYRVNVFEVPRLTAEQVGQFRSDFRIVADYFVQMGRDGDYVPPRQTIEHVDAVLKLLSALTQDHRFEDTQNEFRKGEDVTMLSVLDKVEARGVALGEARGVALGEARGVALGEARGIASTARRMLMRGVPLDQVADFTGLSLGEVEALRREMDN